MSDTVDFSLRNEEQATDVIPEAELLKVYQEIPRKIMLTNYIPMLLCVCSMVVAVVIVWVTLITVPIEQRACSITEMSAIVGGELGSIPS